MEHNKMDKAEFLALIDKFLAGKTNVKEDRLLVNYYESFQEYNEWIAELGDKEILERKMLQRLQQGVALESKGAMGTRLLNPWSFLKYAALFIGIVGLSYVTKDVGGIEDEFPLPSNILDTSTKAITLTRDDGNVEVVPEDGQRKIVDVNGNVVGAQKGNQINYTQGKALEELVYNELMVPYGKQFDLVLSDGTQVTLNSGSSIKYPVQFINGENRAVFLEGEAYFDVAKDEVHPFIVHAKGINIRVLGTKFNLSTYDEDEHIKTVLVEGAVGLYRSDEVYSLDNSETLKPNHKGSWSKSKKEFSFEEVDVRLYTAWVDGKIVFKNTPFKTIRKKLERHYNVTIINNNKTLDEKSYNATFDIETIEEVLKSFNENYEIDFTIVDNQIIIN